MDRQKRLDTMLNLIDERLAAYPVDVTVERLHSYGGQGPTVEEFVQGLDISSKPCNIAASAEDASAELR